MSIMGMPTGTKIRNIRSNLIYVLGNYVNDVARELRLSNGFAIDYINENTQSDYEIVD